jgi:hypothetical protein
MTEGFHILQADAFGEDAARLVGQLSAELAALWNSMQKKRALPASSLKRGCASPARRS